MLARAVLAVVYAQIYMSRRNVEDLLPILTIPLSSFVTLAILQHSGRVDLAGYALVAAVLMSIGQMAFFVGSEILANEREGQTLELVAASPTPYYVPLLARIVVISSMGLFGFVESWLIARWCFGITIPVHHPLIALATLCATIVASSATALITSTVYCFGKTTRTYQNAIAGPLYLLSGVLVPVAFLPEFIQPVSRLIYLFWAADLLRDALQPSPVEHVAQRLGMIAVLGAAFGALGTLLFGRLLTHLRREGTLGL